MILLYTCVFAVNQERTLRVRVAVHRERHFRVSEFVGQPWYAQLCLVVSLFFQLPFLFMAVVWLAFLTFMHFFPPTQPPIIEGRRRS